MILRMGHRIPRDQRITTHVCLTARALGADGVYVSESHDGQLVDTVNKVVEEFGGIFTVETGIPWRSTIVNWKKSSGKVIHLTAYGIPLPKVIKEIRSTKSDKLIVVGAEKMPGEVFQLADWNVAVTSQPISEVSALGIFLDWLYDHRMREEFQGARKRILPSEHGKSVMQTG
jgi:tRNA (cytidine56-2'-O)-methyltransferase